MTKSQSKSLSETLEIVFNALKEKGEDPYVQMAGYLSSGDPAYLPQIHDARNLMSRYGAENIIEDLLRNYFAKSESAGKQ